jgi:hypothetical protein
LVAAALRVREADSAVEAVELLAAAVVVDAAVAAVAGSRDVQFLSPTTIRRI